ncbi:MAG TPA: peptidylprolyl isomerase [Candidatus Eremiobacteraceae bacterium]|nr:peptidylprolyl isomerase [Candidatus Eremiobacteraceae bacterium]
MRKSWLLCVFLGTLAWGQAQPGTPPAPASPAQPPSAANKAPAEPEEVAESAVVLTIKGVCPTAPLKTGTASKTAAGKTTSATTKKPADCKTEITRAQFEKIASGLSPSVTPQLKRQLEGALPRFMAMSEAAKAKGLDKSPRFQETMKVVRMQVLTQELQRTVQEEADNVPPSEIAGYYKKNPEAYEQFSLDRLFIPRFKQAEAEEKEDAKAPEKLTEELQKAKEAAEKTKREQGEQDLNKLADSVRERAAAGEDFIKLQKEAFEAAGTKVDNPTVNLPKVRRTGLPPAHAAVFDLKVSEVSAVISDNGGHYIYKVVTKEVLPLDDQIKAEIHNKLKSERMKEMMDKYTNSFEAVPNEAYFGPPVAPGARPGMPPRMPRPPTAPPPTQQGAPPAANPPSPPPAAPTPPSTPN